MREVTGVGSAHNTMLAGWKLLAAILCGSSLIGSPTFAEEKVRIIRNRDYAGFAEQGEIAISPDGKTVGVARGNRVRLWDVATSKEKPRIACKDTDSFVFLDNHTLAIADQILVRIWDTATEKELFALELKNKVALAGNQIRASADGKTLISFSIGATEDLRVWDMIRRKQTEKVLSREILWDAAITPNGRTIAWSESKAHVARIADVETGRVRAEFNLPEFKAPDRAFERLAIAPDGRKLATVSRRAHIERGMVTGYRDILQIWDVGEPGKPMTIENTHSIQALNFFPDGKRIAVAGSAENPEKKGLIAIYDVAKSKAIRTVSASELLLRIAICSDGKVLGALDRHGDVVLWEP